MPNSNGFTKTEQSMLKVFSDGMRHSREEVHGCLNDELQPLSGIRAHICNMRKKLIPMGENIVCELYGGLIYYRHVRLLSSPYDGKR